MGPCLNCGTMAAFIEIDKALQENTVVKPNRTNMTMITDALFVTFHPLNPPTPC